MKKLNIVFISLLAMGCAHKEPQKPVVAATLPKVPVITNSDGKNLDPKTKVGFDSLRLRDFDRIDKNDDLRISIKSELRGKDKRYAAADANNDGVLNIFEFMNQADKDFEAKK